MLAVYQGAADHAVDLLVAELGWSAAKARQFVDQKGAATCQAVSELNASVLERGLTLDEAVQLLDFKYNRREPGTDDSS